jgi:hypothetical protein
MDATDLVGLIGQDPRGPQGVAQIVTAPLQLRGETTIDGEGGAGPEVVDGAQM